MAATDELIIKIEVENDKALTGIDEVLAKLSSLDRAASKDSLKNFTNLGSTLERFAEASEKLSKVDFTGIQNLFKALENVDAAKMSTGVTVAASSMKKLSEAMKDIGVGGGNLSMASRGIGELSTALRKFTFTDYTESAENVKKILLKLAPAVQQAGKYGTPLNNMRLAIENLGPALRTFGRAETYEEAIGSIAITVKRLVNAIIPLKDAPVQQLKYLADAVKKLGEVGADNALGSNMAHLAKGIVTLVTVLSYGIKDSVAERFAKFTETILPPLRTLSNVLGQFTKMGVDENLGTKLAAASQGIVTLINTLTAGVTPEGAAKFGELANALSGALKPLSNAMSQLQKLGSNPELGANLASAAHGIVSFIETLTSGASAGLMDRFTKVAESMTPAFRSMANGLRNISKIGADEGFAESMASAQQALISFVNSVNTSLSEEAVNRFARLANGIRDVGEALKRINVGAANKIREAIPSNPMIAKLNIFARKLTGVKAGFRSAGDAAKAFGKRMMGIPFSSGTKSVKNLAHQISVLKGRIGRVVLLRMIRSAMAKVTSAIHEGTNALYMWASAYGNSFTATMDSLATSFLYLRNSMAAAASPLVDALAPAINYVIDLLVSALNVFNQFIAAITGATTWRKAIKKAVSYGDSIDGIGDSAGSAGRAAKEFQKQLMGFDEINNLTLPKDSGGGGGGGGGGEDFSGMFEEMDVSSNVADWVSDLKNAWQNNDWSFFEDVGRQIGEKMITGLQNIPWDKIQETAEKLGKAIASTLNGVLEAEVDGVGIGEAIGTALAEAYNSLWTFYDSFLSTFDFTLFGQRIIQGVVSFFRDLDWGLYASTLTHMFTGLLDTLSGLLTGVDWSKIPSMIASQIAEFFGGIPVADLASSIAQFITSAILAVGGLITGIGKLVVEVQQAIIDYFKSYINIDKDDNILDVGRKIIEGIWFGITDAIANAATWLKNNIFVPIIDGIKKAFGIASPAETMKPVGENIIAGIWDGLKGKITDVINWFKELPATIKEAIGDLAVKATATYDAVKGALWDTLLTAWNAIKGAVTTAKATFEAAASSLWTTLKGAWDSVKGAVTTAKATFDAAASNLWTTLKGAWDSLKTTASTIAKATFDAVAGALWNAFITAWDSIKGATTTVTATFNAIFNKGVDTILKIWNKLKKSGKKTITLTANKKGSLKADTLKTIANAWNKISGLGKKFKLTLQSSGITAKLGNAIEKIKNAWNGISGGTKKLTLKFVDAFKNAWSSLKTWLKSNAPQWLLNLVGLKHGGIFKGTQWHPVTAAASGGSFSSGQMFIAREAGPEMVGTIGGNTAVVNNDQIVASVSDGVYRAVVAAMGGSGGDIIIKVDNTVLGRAAINGINNVTRQQGRLMLDLG